MLETDREREIDMQAQHTMYYVVIALIAQAIMYLGWDAVDGVPIMQFSLIFGGALFGHALTEILNQTNDEE